MRTYRVNNSFYRPLSLRPAQGEKTFQDIKVSLIKKNIKAVKLPGEGHHRLLLNKTTLRKITPKKKINYFLTSFIFGLIYISLLTPLSPKTYSKVKLDEILYKQIVFKNQGSIKERFSKMNFDLQIVDRTSCNYRFKV